MSAQISHVRNGENFKTLHFHGTQPEDIQVVVVESNKIKVSGKQKFRSEISNFSYSFILPKNVDVNSIKSQFIVEDNYLKISWSK